MNVVPLNTWHFLILISQDAEQQLVEFRAHTVMSVSFPTCKCTVPFIQIDPAVPVKEAYIFITDEHDP